jgi:hypothetical protein
MALRLIPHSRARARAWWAVVLGVMLAHWLVGHELASTIAGWGAGDEMPARLEVAFVRELAPAAPAPPPVIVKRIRSLRAPAAAASAPDIPAPEPLPEPREVAALAALAPVPDLPAFAQAQDAAASAPAFEWPPSTRLSYSLDGWYRGELQGHAQVQWVHVGTRYQVHLDVSAALLFTRRMTSDGELTDGGLRPRRYDEFTRVAWLDPRQLTMRFEPERVWLANGLSREAPAGVQDTASQFVQLTWLFTVRPELLRVGNRIELPLALPRRVKKVVFDIERQERLETPVGALDTFHLVPQAETHPGNDLTAQVWIAPALQYLPVRIRIHQDAQTYVDLKLATLPLQAEPDADLGAGRLPTRD